MSAGVRAVERFDAEILLRPDGSIQVREQIVVRTDPASPAAFERRIGGERTDEFVDVSASIDGRPAGETGSPAQVLVASGSTLAVQWRLAPASPPSHVLNLSYRATGAVEIQGMRGTVSWAVLPAGRQYEIGSGRVSLTLPQGTRALTPPDIDSSGWQWTSTPDRFVGTKTNIARLEPGILHAELALDAVPMIEPRWQTRAALGQQLTPSFIAAGLFILVTGAGILWAIRLQYFRGTVNPEDARLAQRREVARGLRVAGVVVVVLGLAAAGLAYAVLWSLGPWPQAVPVSLVLVGLWFLFAGRWFVRPS
jgi:Predicted membrane protein (DUF2207) N-terminal domain